MAVTVIQNSCVAGVSGALLSGRSNSALTAAAYALNANIAKAIADEFITVNGASGAAMADADNAQVGPLVSAVAFGVVSGRFPPGASVVAPAAADYVQMATVIYAAAKQSVAKLI